MLCKLEFGVACCLNILIGIWHIRYFFFIFCPAIIWTWVTSLDDYTNTGTRRCTYFGAELTFVAVNFLQKYSWYSTIHFQFHLLVNWTILAFVSSRLAWKSPANSLFLSLKSSPVFWVLSKFQHNIKISIKTARVSRRSPRWRVTVSGELMFVESYGNCDVTITVTLLLWRHKIISLYDF